MNFIIIRYLIYFLLLFSNSIICQSNSFFIRLTQVGYLPQDLKSGIIISEREIPFVKFNVIDEKSGDKIFSNNIYKSDLGYGKFKHCYTLDFSDLSSAGQFTIQIGEEYSHPFNIGDDVFNHISDSLELFFKAQRCGPTIPILHSVCHLSDVTSLSNMNKDTTLELTGGWHDAGDYIKFFSTTAITTYLLLFSYKFDKDKFDYDNNKNGVTDILEEVKIGLDWLLRCNFSDSLFIVQVQNERDHTVGWRMPENDSFRFDRPGFSGIGKNLIGIFSAVMAIASGIWKERYFDFEFSDKCLNAAIQKYSIHKSVVDVDNSYSTNYTDNNYLGKLALGAIELYSSTGDNNYLDDAIEYGDSAKADLWWSWGDINSLAHYKISKVVPRFTNYIKQNLDFFNSFKDSSLFSKFAKFRWGSTTTILGIALQSILYSDLTGSNEYDSLLVLQRDYILGRNPWGLSFIYGIGEVYPLHLHSQIAYFNKGYLPGAVTGGAVSVQILKRYSIERSDSTYSKFNTDSESYYDDWNDYITNEPTIFGNATALFVFGALSGVK